MLAVQKVTGIECKMDRDWKDHTKERDVSSTYLYVP